MKTIGSLFAGIGGFDLGFERAGFKTAWTCEIDQKAQAVLRYRFPDAVHHDDVTQVGAHNLGPVDVVTFGSPCQDLSVAGKRAGLAGGRSGLFHEAVRIIRELRAAHGKPDFAVWENVPGAFSSNGGRDFAVVVQEMVNLGARDVAWRVLDSRFFGVAQRRRRVFLVADFGGERAEQVLALTEGVRGYSPKGRKARQGVAQGAGEGAGSGRGYVPNVTGCLDAGTHPGSYSGQDVYQDRIIAQPLDVYRKLALSHYTADGTASTMKQRDHKEATDLVAQPIAFHPTQDPISSTEQTHSLSCGSKSGTASVAVMMSQAVEPYTLEIRGREGGRVLEYRQDGTANCLRTPNGGRDGMGMGAVAFEPRYFTRDNKTGGAPTQTPALTATAYKAGDASPHVAYGFYSNEGSHGMGDNREVAPSLKIGGGSAPPAAAIFDSYNQTSHDVSFPLRVGLGNESGDQIPRLYGQQPAVVRRLTPVECCRLQGFPDEWNAEGIDKTGKRIVMADSSRYKQLGNAVTVNVAEWLAKRISAAI